MRFGKSEYEITMSGVSRGEAEKEDDDSVTIESQRIEKESEKVVDPEESSDEINVMEHYAPIREMDFEPKEAQEVFEKKKKGRNYLEFREDYEAQEE